MRTALIATALAASALATAPPARAEDNQAGVPLAPSEAPGAWTLAAGGHDICVVTLTAKRTGPGVYAAQVPAACASDLPGAPAAWQPTADGMRFVAADGEPAIAFNRWSNSLFVSRRESGVDLQLRRGRGPAG